MTLKFPGISTNVPNALCYTAIPWKAMGTICLVSHPPGCVPWSSVTAIHLRYRYSHVPPDWKQNPHEIWHREPHKKGGWNFKPTKQTAKGVLLFAVPPPFLSPSFTQCRTPPYFSNYIFVISSRCELSPGGGKWHQGYHPHLINGQTCWYNVTDDECKSHQRKNYSG